MASQFPSFLAPVRQDELTVPLEMSVIPTPKDSPGWQHLPWGLSTGKWFQGPHFTTRQLEFYQRNMQFRTRLKGEMCARKMPLLAVLLLSRVMCAFLRESYATSACH